MAVERVFTAAELAEAAAIAGEEPPIDSWTPIDLNTLPEKPPVPPELGNTHLVYPGKRHVFSGQPESAKTLAAYCVLIQLVRCAGTGILIDFEMGGYDARQRLRELGATPAEIARIYYLEPDEPVSTAHIAGLISLDPQLVVIDASAGIYSLEGLDDNKRTDVEKISNLYIRMFWRSGIATILIDHVVKDSEARGRYAIGSERKLGGADVHLGFDTHLAISRGGSGHYKIITHKDRGGYLKRGRLADLHLDSDPDTHQIEWKFTDPDTASADDGPKRYTNIMEKASVVLELATEPMTRNAVDAALDSRKQFVLKAIDSLISEGFVTVTESNRLVSSRPYREHDASCNPQNQGDGSAVPVWFRSGSGNQSVEGGSLVPVSLETEPAVPPTTPNGNGHVESGWFRPDGSYSDIPELTDDDDIFRDA